MRDALGRPLAVGDVVMIPAVVTELRDNTHYNVTAKSLGKRPDGVNEVFGAINGQVALRARSDDDLLAALCSAFPALLPAPRWECDDGVTGNDHDSDGA